MKTSDRLATILFLLAAPAARFLELKNNYDPAGLPTGGFPYLPARDAVTADFGGIFRFDGQLTLTAAVLGGFLLLAAAAVLALQQLSQGADNAGRYAILRRLGAQESMVSRCAVEQVALAFLLPLALALIHSVVGMKAANDFIAQAGKVDALQSTAVTALMLLVVYGGYFLATALACRRLALQGTGARR